MCFPTLCFGTRDPYRRRQNQDNVHRDYYNARPVPAGEDHYAGDQRRRVRKTPRRRRHGQWGYDSGGGGGSGGGDGGGGGGDGGGGGGDGGC
ncbi:hypothetical protein E4U54_001040 [Claviceps lovelessii]|nr:hypothetical protein E4U54_001040 [Claviceps lovelessii]